MVHQFSFDGLHIALDVYSGQIHVLDEVSRDVLPLYQQYPLKDILNRLRECYSVNEIEDAYQELTMLKDAGRLFSEDVLEQESQKLAEREPILKALCLHIAHDCNLKCQYCFAGEGEYHGDRSLMSAETGKKALDFLVKRAGKRRNLEVDFFGGEPTLNFDVVKEIVHYGRSLEEAHQKRFRFTLTTNGLLLDDAMIDFANAQMDNVVLSIDGRKEVNDRVRQTRGSKGSYDSIVPKFKNFIEKRQGQYYLRGTYTRFNLDFTNDIFHLAGLGFDQISVEPVVAPPDAPYSIREEDLEALKTQYDLLAREIAARNKSKNQYPYFNFFHFNMDLQGGSCAIKKISGCGAGCEYLSVTPSGDLYPCHQFTGLSDFKVGSVYTGIDNPAIPEDFRKVNVYSKPACQDCWAKFFCSGGCSANAYQLAGDIHAAYPIGCELQKKRIENAIYIQAARFVEDAD